MIKDIDRIRRVITEDDDKPQQAIQPVPVKRSKTDIAIELLENFTEIFGEDDELVTKILDKVTVDDICIEVGKYNSRLADFIKVWLRFRLSRCGQYGEEKHNQVQQSHQ
ncbi:MAG: hypothetical protein RXQ74_01275 [Caldivirga sp.]|jgi:hypothetical protein|uniref:hypothetical protein n=1 Tax=Caldivirga sp. MU80 TaxID=1650354 RepID=UPI00074ABBD5|nr:hypothetical protein [Caldivirga sp. MU80]KUO82964.1 MAG: hypothetical protein AT709_04330 [Caldivirga sp. MG_3]KUO87903.1 MAG: hypothetical protein AT712_05245 [Caldivirga sp. CIS_19]NAZ28233.1 hypothetical protein [Caldivirga sp.]